MALKWKQQSTAYNDKQPTKVLLMTIF